MKYDINDKSHTTVNEHRLSTNPREKLFLDKWREMNLIEWSRHSILDYILSIYNEGDLVESNPRDDQVAESLMQWLGTPVGWNFIQEVVEEAKKSEYNVC
jgi:hypothetical protein